MDLFSISQLSQLSGIKPHTIRIWEKRYNALTPTRSQGNTRYYGNDQLRRLLNIVSLLELNYKISQLGSMTDEQLYKIIEKTSYMSLPGTADYFVLHLTRAGLSYDEPLFDKMLSHCLLRYGMKETYLRIIYPMLARVGLMWSCNNMPPAIEHFISNLLRQKILTAIDSLPHANLHNDVWLLFLPEDEFHEMGLLFAHYLIRFSGRKVIYLGANVPFDSLAAAIHDSKASKLLLFFVHRNLTGKTEDYLNKLSKIFPAKQLFVCGSQKLMSQLRFPKKIKWLSSVDDLEHQINDV
jgi:hypothetical protein